MIKGSSEKNVFRALAVLFALRVIALFTVPFNEVTEARYGEIARKMLETGNWVTPQHDYGVPFWAKPPLWSWLSAASMGVFGVNEFAARLPHFLLSLAVIALVAMLAKVRSGREAGISAALVLASCGGFYAGGAAVMTDPALVFCVTLIMVSFWMAFQGKDKIWGWLFFAGLGLGMLAKGPIAAIIPGVPVFFWVLRRGEWRRLWESLPWIRGFVLAAVIAVPWYVLAEIRTPGFLNYFIVGEHISRFLDKGWNGDKYGYAHQYPFGMIWVFVLAGLTPWVLLLPSLGRKIKSVWKDDDGWMLFIALWSFASVAFFTFAANIIWPYCMAALPGFALLFAEVWARTGEKRKVFPAVLLAVAGVVMLVGSAIDPPRFTNTEKDVVLAWKAQNPSPDSKLLFWGHKQEFSPAFYSAGRARVILSDPAPVEALLHNKTQDYIVSTAEALDGLPKNVLAHFDDIGHFTNGRGERVLLREKMK